MIVTMSIKAGKLKTPRTKRLLEHFSFLNKNNSIEKVRCMKKVLLSAGDIVHICDGSID